MLLCCICVSCCKKSYNKFFKHNISQIVKTKSSVPFNFNKETVSEDLKKKLKNLPFILSYQIQPGVLDLEKNLNIESPSPEKAPAKYIGSLEYGINYDFSKEEVCTFNYHYLNEKIPLTFKTIWCT